MDWRRPAFLKKRGKGEHLKRLLDLVEWALWGGRKSGPSAPKREFLMTSSFCEHRTNSHYHCYYPESSRFFPRRRTHPSEQDQADATVYRRTKMEQKLKKRTKSIVGFRILSQGEGFFGNDHYGGFLPKKSFSHASTLEKETLFYWFDNQLGRGAVFTVLSSAVVVKERDIQIWTQFSKKKSFYLKWWLLLPRYSSPFWPSNLVHHSPASSSFTTLTFFSPKNRRREMEFENFPLSLSLLLPILTAMQPINGGRKRRNGKEKKKKKRLLKRAGQFYSFRIRQFLPWKKTLKAHLPKQLHTFFLLFPPKIKYLACRFPYQEKERREEEGETVSRRFFPFLGCPPQCGSIFAAVKC